MLVLNRLPEVGVIVPTRGAWIEMFHCYSKQLLCGVVLPCGARGLKSELGRDPCRDYGLTSFVVCGNRRTDKKQTAPERIWKRIFSGAVILYLRKSIAIFNNTAERFNF